MKPAIQYWLSLASPWAWLGSSRFIGLAGRSGATVEVLPVDLGAVFAATGGTDFRSRSPARQGYRQLELARWSKRLGIPIMLEPRHYPVDREPASRLVIAARMQGADVLPLTHAILGAIWHEERDIADWATLREIASACRFDGAGLVAAAQAEGPAARYRADTQRAIESGVFGSPTWIVEGERFWGQDRLDFLAERLGVALP